MPKRLLLKVVIGLIQVIEHIVDVPFVPRLPSMFCPTGDSLFEFAQRFDLLVFTWVGKRLMTDVTMVVVQFLAVRKIFGPDRRYPGDTKPGKQ